MYSGDPRGSTKPRVSVMTHLTEKSYLGEKEDERETNLFWATSVFEVTLVVLCKVQRCDILVALGALLCFAAVSGHRALAKRQHPRGSNGISIFVL